MTNENPLATSICDRHEALKGQRSPWETLWREIAKYVMPRRAPGIQGTVESPNTGNEAVLFDTTAVNANMVLANGQLAWMSPLESPWFNYGQPSGARKDDDAARWLHKATAVTRDELAISNFYTAVHEFYLDRGAFGTACLYIEPGRRNLLNAQAWPIGTYVIDEDENGIVDTVIREFYLTPRQAVQKFGEDKLSDIVVSAANDPKRCHKRMGFLHAIYPRQDYERDKSKMDGPNMPIANVYLEKDTRHICGNGGFEEMPVMVSRYLEWGSGTGSLYGWSPSFTALPEARQLNWLQMMLDALGEKAAFPPMLAPEELEGEIDTNPHGVTYFSKDLAGSLPKQLIEAGRYDIGVLRVQERQKAIREAFHVDLFQMFAQLTKQMTAREVAERSQEKLIQFSPTFSRLVCELFNPLLERVFGILLRTGKFGPLEEIPSSMRVPIDDMREFIAPPSVQYSSRIALALRALPAIGYQRTLERLMVTAQMNPAVLDNYDFDKAERETAMFDGVPADYLKSKADVDKARKARAQAQAVAQQKADAMAMAEGAAKLGSVRPESPVNDVVRNQLGEAA